MVFHGLPDARSVGGPTDRAYRPGAIELIENVAEKRGFFSPSPRNILSGGPYPHVYILLLQPGPTFALHLARVDPLEKTRSMTRIAPGPSQQEAQLARSACRGDAEAFSTLVHRYQRPVYHLCLRHLAPPDAEDIAQETFVRAFVHIRRFDPEKPLLPWLFTIARRLCIDRLRKKTEALETEPDNDRVRDPNPDAEQQAICREQVGLLKRGLSALAEGPREAVALYHFEGMAYRDIAEVLGVPEGTVMTWLHRGRAQLRALLAAGARNGPAKDETGEARPSDARGRAGRHGQDTKPHGQHGGSDGGSQAETDKREGGP